MSTVASGCRRAAALIASLPPGRYHAAAVTTPPNDHETYEERPLPLEDWADINTLLHRTSLTSGDFDYVLVPACPDCGRPLDTDYDEEAEDEPVLVALSCDECGIVWVLEDDQDFADGLTGADEDEDA